MEWLQHLIDLFLHLDQYLSTFVQAHGSWVYALLFLVIFAETGLVVTPFLPGDSLLFVAGTLAGVAAMDVWLLTPLLIVAAILGDNTNYWIGRFFGQTRVFRKSPAFLSTAWGQGGDLCTLFSHPSYFCTVRGRYWPDALSPLFEL